MSINNYIEFDSTYRDRNKYPLVSNFVMDISQTGQEEKRYARDPVSTGSPKLYWSNSFRETANSNTTGANISVVNTTSTSGDTVLLISAAAGILRQVDNFYNGAILDITNGGVANTRRRIIDYEVINTTRAYITLESPFPSDSFGADGEIANPTNIDTSTANSVIKFFIPGGVDIENFYSFAFIQSLGAAGGGAEIRLILTYDSHTHLATLDQATSVNWITDYGEIFVIRWDVPDTIDSFQAVSANGRRLQLSNLANSINESYVSSFLRMLNPVPTSVAGYSVEAAPYDEERRIIEYKTGGGTFAAIAAGGITFTLNNDASSTEDFYVGSFITNSTTGNTREVATYDSTTKSGTVTAAWGGGAAAGDTWYVRTATIASPFSVNPTAGQTYELLLFSYDNYTPFRYSGSSTAQNQAVCYEVELLSLILPNKPLLSSLGGNTIATFPYLYVELENMSSSTAFGNNVIYSNNPNSTKSVFRATVDDTPTPAISDFVRIDGDGVVQTIKFKPNDSLRFTIKLPNGELFLTQLGDTTGPEPPDPRIQINALFNFHKVN